MFKGFHWKGIGTGFFWLFCLCSLVLLMSFIEDKKHDGICRKIKIDITDNHRYIEQGAIKKLLTKDRGPLIGQILYTLPIHEIENILKANPFIERAEAYMDIDGTVSIRIKQREPVIRVLTTSNQDFYIDHNGLKMPISEVFTANVLVANGFIREKIFKKQVDTLSTNIAKDLFKTALFIEKDALWSQQIEQIYVNENGEFELIPRVGDHKIILGTTEALETKFNNLLLFYKKIIPTVGWNRYEKVNLKYQNQIICERTNGDSPTNRLNKIVK